MDMPPTGYSMLSPEVMYSNLFNIAFYTRNWQFWPNMSKWGSFRAISKLVNSDCILHLCLFLDINYTRQVTFTCVRSHFVKLKLKSFVLKLSDVVNSGWFTALSFIPLMDVTSLCSFTMHKSISSASLLRECVFKIVRAFQLAQVYAIISHPLEVGWSSEWIEW